MLEPTLVVRRSTVPDAPRPGTDLDQNIRHQRFTA
jgi:hypothetical protein